MISLPIWIRLCALSFALAGQALAQVPDGAIYEGASPVLRTGAPPDCSREIPSHRATVRGSSVLLSFANTPPTTGGGDAIALRPDGSFEQTERNARGVGFTIRGRLTAQGGSWEYVIDVGGQVMCLYHAEARRAGP